jgi:hypothetical protein
MLLSTLAAALARRWIHFNMKSTRKKLGKLLYMGSKTAASVKERWCTLHGTALQTN